MKSPQVFFMFSTKDLVFLLPITICAFIIFFAINYFLKFGVIGLNRKNLSKLHIIILYAGLLIAVPEEIIFRGFVQTYFYSILDAPNSIILSSLFFGLAHVLNGAKGFRLTEWNWKLVTMTFMAGMFLGFSFYVTGSLVVPVVLHTLFIIVMKVFIKDTV
ncbi:MAG: hypothetical protein JWN37_90 [Candidatus Nomurabacteria bacterium]|nr:hypothetical protein [Candidatus Nomurabacteria bacterium]